MFNLKGICDKLAFTVGKGCFTKDKTSSHAVSSQTTEDLCLTLQREGGGYFLWPACVTISTYPKVVSAGDPPNPHFVKFRSNNLLSAVFLKVMWLSTEKYHWEI